MKIVVAPDSFKESLRAKEVAEIIEEGIKRVFPQVEVIKVPLADGGEGTIEAILEARGGKVISQEVASPLGERIKAHFGILDDGFTGIVEMAQASGLSLVPQSQRNPLLTTTYGTGELIKATLDRGCKRIIVGIGGSATVDGGAGMVQALGANLLNGKGKQISFGGGSLGEIVSIDMSSLDSRVKNTEVLVASDVDNPLCGPKGAARVYGPQKGATPEMVKTLEKNLAHFAMMIKKYLNKEVKNIPGAGAAGGLGAGLIAFLGAELRPGIKLMIEASRLEERIKGADLVISGEGRIDEQTVYGKTPVGVAEMAKKEKIPVIIIGGEIRGDVEALYERGVDAVVSCIDRILPRAEAMKEAKETLRQATERAMRLIKIGMS
ncbi:glycerate kinase [Candidatus Aerophobetes bacterium]|nr:glycerate kinase [Candidatus Aerophobetes bacterium]